MDPLKFLKKKSKLVLDQSMKAYDYVKSKVKAGYVYLVDKKARWRKYYNEIKSYFSPRSISFQLVIMNSSRCFSIAKFVPGVSSLSIPGKI